MTALVAVKAGLVDPMAVLVVEMVVDYVSATAVVLVSTTGLAHSLGMAGRRTVPAGTMAPASSVGLIPFAPVMLL